MGPMQGAILPFTKTDTGGEFPGLFARSSRPLTLVPWLPNELSIWVNLAQSTSLFVSWMIPRKRPPP
jgi:hypothetical protein